MIVVTGGAGFIGANLIKTLNEKGRKDILVVDDFSSVEKVPNLADCIVADYMDKATFRLALQAPELFMEKPEVIFHQGACSNTMATDGHYVMDNNYQFSKEVLNYCQLNAVTLIYASSASVYGGNEQFIEHPDYEKPLNAYAYSKLLFDQHVRQRKLTSPVIGLRYFNVYGYREQHKKNMASVAFHFSNQFRENGKVKLFEGTAGYENGGQLRDFVFVEDVVDVNLHFWQSPVSGIYNLGTGTAQSFNDVAVNVVNYFRRQNNEPDLQLEEMIRQELITYIPFPPALAGKYQSYTCANIEKLQKSGYTKPFQLLDEAVPKYLNWLQEKANA